MQRRILKHLTNYNTLSTEQYSFRLWLGTDNATYKITTEILNAMNNVARMGGGERCAQGSSEETQGKEAIGETQT